MWPTHNSIPARQHLRLIGQLMGHLTKTNWAHIRDQVSYVLVLKPEPKVTPIEFWSGAQTCTVRSIGTVDLLSLTVCTSLVAIHDEVMAVHNLEGQSPIHGVLAASEQNSVFTAVHSKAQTEKTGNIKKYPKGLKFCTQEVMTLLLRISWYSPPWSRTPWLEWF